MALSSMGGIASSGLGQMRQAFEGIVKPLDAIESRRKARAAEDMAQRETAAKEQKAAAAKQAADEAQRAGEAKRQQDAQTQQVLAGGTQITVDSMNDPAFTQQLRAKVKHLMNSGNPVAIDKATAIMKQLETFSKSGALDVETMEDGSKRAGTMQSEIADVSMAQRESETQLNRSMSQVKRTEPSKVDSEWATAYVHENDPGRQGWGWKKNYPMEKRARLSATLLALLDQVKANYAAQSGGQQMPIAEAQKWAIQRFNEMMEKETGAQPAQAPQQAPAQPQGKAAAKYNWSN